MKTCSCGKGGAKKVIKELKRFEGKIDSLVASDMKVHKEMDKLRLKRR
jgi:hypothetical protein